MRQLDFLESSTSLAIPGCGIIILLLEKGCTDYMFNTSARDEYAFERGCGVNSQKLRLMFAAQFLSQIVLSTPDALLCSKICPISRPTQYPAGICRA